MGIDIQFVGFLLEYELPLNWSCFLCWLANIHRMNNSTEILNEAEAVLGDVIGDGWTQSHLDSSQSIKELLIYIFISTARLSADAINIDRVSLMFM